MTKSKILPLKEVQSRLEKLRHSSSQNEAKALMSDLLATVDYHNIQYHEKDKSEISDLEFDQLHKNLEELEELYPQIKKGRSATATVGGKALAQFKKVAHRVPMLSLSNTYSPDEIRDFDTRAKKYLDLKEGRELIYLCEPKIDGLAIEVIYEKGILTRGLTRGDGLTGEDVTENIKTIKVIPHKLKTSRPPPLLEVRGEIVLFKKDFAALNQEQIDEGEDLFVNARNTAAGSIRQLDPQIAASRPLKAFFYGSGIVDWANSNATPENHCEFEKLLGDFGLPVNDLAKKCKNIDEVIEYYFGLEKKREKLDYEIDGIVVKVDSLKLQKDLGFIARSPRWAVAAKYKPQQVQTVIEKIEIQVGRTGALTPVAVMTPIKVGGVTVTNATLHNQDEIDRKDTRVGDTVVIQRAGDVIPEIVSVVSEKRPKNSKAFKIPGTCPVCGSKAVKLEGEAVTRCTNSLCVARLKESLKHFVSRRAMNIEKLGDKLIEQLVDLGVAKSFSDIYRLNEQKISQLPRQGDKSTNNLIESIEKSKESTLNRFIFAMGIRFVGEQTARLLAKNFSNVERFLEATEEELLNVDEVGEKVAKSIIESTGNKTFSKEMLALVKLGVHIPGEKQVGGQRKQNNSLEGFTFVITGSLDGMSRDEAKDFIENHGGITSSSVSKKTNFLVCGSDAGSKLIKAQELGVKIISLDELKRMSNK